MKMEMSVKEWSLSTNCSQKTEIVILNQDL